MSEELNEVTGEVTEVAEVTAKRDKKLSKSIDGTTVVITVVGGEKGEMRFDVETLPSAYYSFATGWTTAYFLNGFGKTAIKLYFIQDFEPYFFAKGSEYEFAEKTYTLGFVAVCAGQWLASTMTKNYAAKSHAIGFSYDRSTYVRTPRREPHVRRIFFKRALDAIG